MSNDRRTFVNDYSSDLELGVTGALSRRYGDLMAIRDANTQLTYTELDRQCTAMAKALLSCGLGVGDVVAWMSPTCAEFVVAYFATANAGLRFAPLNTRLTASELHTVVELLRPAAVIASAEYLTALDIAIAADLHPLRLSRSDTPSAAWQCLGDLIASAPSSIAKFPGNPNSPHEVLFTSGTTGEAKGVEKLQSSRLQESLAALDALGNPDGIHQIRVTPQFHMGGIMGPYQSLLSGGTVTVRTFSADVVAQAISDGANFIAAVPAQMSIVLNSGAMAGIDSSAVRYCSVGGSASSPHEIDKIRSAFPCADLVHIYGSTEAGLVSTIGGEDYLQRPDSIGRPVKGVDIRVVDDTGTEAPQGTIGELHVRSPFMMQGYYRRPDMTRSAVSSDGYLAMGDLVRRDEDGYLYIVGRKKDMIVTGGENVYPSEVEDVISELEMVTGVSVISQPDNTFQEIVTAVVTIEVGCTPDPNELADSLTELASSALAGYKVPRQIYLAPHLPLNATGKVDKALLREMLPGLTRIR